MYRQELMHEMMQKEVIRYKEQYTRMQKELRKLPKGSLTIDRHGNLCRYIKDRGKQYRVILPPHEYRLIIALKKRRYIKAGMYILEKRIKACEKFLEMAQLYDPRKIEAELPVQYRGMQGIDVFLRGDINVEEWIKKPHRRNPRSIATPHYTAGGVVVRSKSEAIIGTRLEERKVLFRPEPEIQLRSYKAYPDFEIFQEKHRRLVYWEHLGMIDDEGYMFSNLRKLEDYAEHGIRLGDNLFITYESKSRPFSIADADAKLNEILRS